jgi:hypothetical protein
VVSRSKHGKAYLFSFNYIVWPELKEFVTSLQEYQVLRLVPREALLIKSYETSVLFKSIRPQDATPTSFCAYKDYGIELELRDNYYTLPKRELSRRSSSTPWTLKNRDKLEAIDHPIIKDLKAVLQGERIRGYPTLEDIGNRTGLYDIQF